MLSHQSLRLAGFEERFAAARQAGFDALGLNLRSFVEAEEAGITHAQMLEMVKRYEVDVAEIEVIKPFWSDPDDFQRALAAEFVVWRMADTFGCRYVQAIGSYHGEIEVAARSFAGLCDRAAQHGLTVGLEFLPFTNIPDAATAAQIVDLADRPNGGVCVDSWHHFRGAADDGMLRALTAKRITGVQVDDGTLRPENPDYYTDCLENRKVPGEGEFDLVGFLRLLDEMDVSVPVSLEVISTELQQLPPGVAATRIRDGFLRVLAASRS